MQISLCCCAIDLWYSIHFGLLSVVSYCSNIVGTTICGRNLGNYTENNRANKMNSNEIPPTDCPRLKFDSRRSWFICIGAAFLVGVARGLTNNFGILFVSLLDGFHESKQNTAWVGAIQLIWNFITSSLANSLAMAFGFKRVAFIGGIFVSLGLLLSSFAHQLWVLYFTYGILFATGTSFIFITSVTILQFCFKEHLATASGIVIAGNSILTICIGPLYEYLIRAFGWRVALRFLSLIMVPIALACAVFPNKSSLWLPKETDANMKYFAVLGRFVKNKSLLLWGVVMMLVYLGLFVPFVHLISFSKDIGIATNVSVYSISCISLLDAFGKVSLGKLLDRFHWDIFKVNTIAILTLAVSITLLPMVTEIYQLFLFAAFFGFGLGVQCLLVLIISPQLCEPRNSKHAIAYVFTIVSLPAGLGPTMAGWIYDTTNSYRMAFFISGGLFALSAFLSVFLSFIQNTWSETETLCHKDKEFVELKELSSSRALLNDETDTMKRNSHSELRTTL